MPRSPIGVPFVLLVVGALALAGGGVRAAVLTVDCDAGPFTDIGAAVDASQPGDTIAVEPCASASYPPFVVAQKERLHIVGLGDRPRDFPIAPPRPDFRPPVEIGEGDGGIVFSCAEITRSAKISLTGFTFTDCGFHAVSTELSTDVSIVGNRFETGFETFRDQGSTGTRLVANLFVDTVFAVFLDGEEAFVSQNLILNDGGSGIAVLTPSLVGNQIVGNVVRGANLEAISDAGVETRIERNVCHGNLQAGGQAEIVLTANSLNADVVGNLTGGSILDLGTGTDLAGNR